jgi:hypothetical protein
MSTPATLTATQRAWPSRQFIRVGTSSNGRREAMATPCQPFWPGDLQVRQAGGGEGLAWKLALLALDLLQAQDIGRLLVDEAGDLLGAEADGVDVPGGDTKAHGLALEGSGVEPEKKNAPAHRRWGESLVSHAATGRG